MLKPGFYWGWLGMCFIWALIISLFFYILKQIMFEEEEAWLLNRTLYDVDVSIHTLWAVYWPWGPQWAYWTQPWPKIMTLVGDKNNTSSRSSNFLVVSFIVLVLTIITIAAFAATFFGGLAYYLGDTSASQDQRREQLIDDIFGGTWRYSSGPIIFTLIIYSLLFFGRLSDTETDWLWCRSLATQTNISIGKRWKSWMRGLCKPR